jgi:hypothetical protein
MIYVYFIIVINHKDMLFTGKTACYVCAPPRKQTGNVVLPDECQQVGKIVWSLLNTAI